jgi:uncharacterized membrane protein
MAVQERLGIELTTLIDAPVAAVFDYYSNPANLPEIWPSMLAVSDITTDDKGNPRTFRWIYKMAGIRLKGSSRVTVFERNRRVVTKSVEGVESYFDVSYDDKAGMTEVRERVEYRILNCIASWRDLHLELGSREGRVGEEFGRLARGQESHTTPSPRPGASRPPETSSRTPGWLLARPWSTRRRKAA